MKIETFFAKIFFNGEESEHEEHFLECFGNVLILLSFIIDITLLINSQSLRYLSPNSFPQSALRQHSVTASVLH